MKIVYSQVEKNLEKKLAPTYLVFGDDPLLKSETLDFIAKASKKEHFDEVHRFVMTTGFDWSPLYELCHSLSLFSSRIRIELTIPPSTSNTTTTVIKKDLATQLVKLSEMLHSDLLFILTGEKLAAKQERESWFTSLKGTEGVYIVCNTPSAEQLPQFIATRCQQMKMIIDPPAIALLAQLHEGNLLALIQSLQLLKLLYPDGHLTLFRIEETLSQQSCFTPFQLIDALLLGKLPRSQRILKQLENAAEEPTIILRVLQKEIVTLLKIKQQQLSSSATHTSLSQLLSKYAVWSQRQLAFTKALERLTLEQIKLLVNQINRLEMGLKTDVSLNVWHELSYLCFLMTTTKTPLYH